MFTSIKNILNKEIDFKSLAKDHEQYKYTFMDTQAFNIFGLDIVVIIYAIIAFFSYSDLGQNIYFRIQYASLFLIALLAFICSLYGFLSDELKQSRKKWVDYFDRLSFYMALIYVGWGELTIHLSILQNQVVNFMISLMIYSLFVTLINYSPKQSGALLLWWVLGCVSVITIDLKYNPIINDIDQVITFGFILVVMYSIKYYSGVGYYKARLHKELTIKEYNLRLKKEVEKKTERIELMNDKLIMAMADMVEGRDLNTGGHIKRTSQGVAILVEELKKIDKGIYTDIFCDALIKAAPMHDLGKITIRDDILRKPGKFTKEEFEIMKTHSANGKDIIHKILEEIDDDYFRCIAENVACYHHERFDGSGYPKGLKGEEIPLEARIMAIADVYDALVSKRCYKDSYSFEKAASIIGEGMGTQFDPALNEAFLACKDKFEEYYETVLH